MESKKEEMNAQATREPPKHLDGGDEAAIKGWFDDFGSIRINKINNRSSHRVSFYNPDEKKGGTIEPGQSETDKCVGFIPYYSHSRKYEITYYNVELNKEETMTIKDLGGDWLLSFETPGTDEDIRSLRPPFTCRKHDIAITIKDSGYETYSNDWACTVGQLSWRRWG